LRIAATTLLVAVLAGCTPPDPPLRVGLLEWPPYDILRLARLSGDLPAGQFELVQFRSPAEASRAYAAGGIDIVALPLDYEIRLAEGSDDHRAFIIIDESAGGDAIIGRQPFDSLAGIAGSTIGLESSELGIHMLSRLLDHAGLTAADIDLAFHDYPDQADAWRQGSVDLMITYEPNRSRLLQMGGQVLFSSADIPGEIIDVFIARQSQIEARNADFRRFSRAWFSAVRDWEGDSQSAASRLAPRLGMLSWDVDAFLESARRDLFFVPIAITYERLVEEGAMVELLAGGPKQKESMLGLVRARKFLQRRFGSVHVNFGEPISLALALGDRRRHLRHAHSDAVIAEKRRFVESLAKQIVERINWTVVPNATSVASSVLLGARSRGLLRGDLVWQMQRMVELLRMQGVRLTAALGADEQDFSEAIAFLQRSDLVRSVQDPRGEILYFEDGKLQALDIYRNSMVHYLAVPSFLARRLREGASIEELRLDVANWQQLLYQEFFIPREAVLEAQQEAFVQHFEREGWIERDGERLVPTGSDRGFFACLAQQTRGVIEAYHAACTALEHFESDFDRKEFYKRAAEHFQHSELLGEAGRREASNETTFSNALDLLLRRGILREEQSTGRRRDTRFARGEDPAQLEPLRRFLADALDAR